MNRKICLMVFLLLILNLFSTNVLAAQDLTNKTVVIYENQKVDNVFLFGKDGIISGEVNDEVIIINGNLTLTKTARIKDRIFILGGELTQEPGARVEKGIFYISLSNKDLNSILLGIAAFIIIEVGKLLLALFILFVSFLSALLLKSRIDKTKAILQKNFIKTGLLGLLAAIGLVSALIASMVTIIGIPIAILLGIIFIILLSIGLGPLSLIIGELLLKSFTWSNNKPTLQILIGSLFIISLLNFPILGIFWGLAIFSLAIGTLILSFLTGREV